jgi:hypothetical protein
MGPPMSDQAPRCQLCGRLAPRLPDGYCDDRCRALAAAGYSSPKHDPAALAAPRTAVEARVLVGGEVTPPLPSGCARIAELTAGRWLVRAGAQDWTELDEVLGELRDTAPSDSVEIFTLQQFSPGGLGGPETHLPEREKDAQVNDRRKPN